MKKTLATALVVLIAYLLQTTLIHGIALGGIMPNFILLVAVYVGYINGRVSGTITGLIMGFLLDCQYGTLIGVYAFMYMVIGYGSGYCSRLFYREDYTMPVALVFLGEISYGIMCFLMLFLLRGKLDILFYFKTVVFPELVYSLLFSILVYKIIIWAYNIASKNEKEAL